MTPLKVVTVNGSVNRVSKTGALLDLALETLTEKAREAFLDVEPVPIELRTLRLDLAQAMSEDDLPEPVQHAIATMTGADLVIVGTPIYKASYSGLFKQFFDVVDQYPLAIDTALRPLFAYFQAQVAPVGIYATSERVRDTARAEPPLCHPEPVRRTE